MSVNKIVTLDNMTEYTTKMKDYVDPLFIDTLEDILSLSGSSTRSEIITAFGGQTKYDKFLSYAKDKRVIWFGNSVSSASVEGNSIIKPINIHYTKTSTGGVDTQNVSVVIEILNETYAIVLEDDGTIATFDLSIFPDQDEATYLGELREFSTQASALNLNSLKPRHPYFIKTDTSTQDLNLVITYNNTEFNIRETLNSSSGIHLLDGYITLIVNNQLPDTVIASTPIYSNDSDFSISYIGRDIFKVTTYRDDFYLITTGPYKYTSSTNTTYVSPTGAQTISGLKTFSTLPESSVTPTTNNQLVNKSYVDTTVSTAMSSAIKREIINTLPTQDIKTDTIYMVPKSTAGTNDVYDEYMYINSAWELIGTTQVDLSNYLAKNNTSAFTPSGDYNPATKKYVDDSIPILTYATTQEIDALFS